MWNWVDKLQELKKENKAFALVTITDVKGSTPREIGAKMIIVSKELFFGTVGGGNLEKLIIEQAIEAIKVDKSGQFSYPLGVKAGQCCGGSVDVFIEAMNERPHLFIYGGGHIGTAICSVLKDTPFFIHLIEDRLEWLEGKNIPSEVSLHPGSWKKNISNFNLNEKNSYAVIMTYSHQRDEEILECLVKEQHRYLGLIGSQTKWDRIQSRLREKGVLQLKLDLVKCPIGFDIGGKSPQEIAISFASEILAIHYNKITHQDSIFSKYQENKIPNDILWKTFC